MNDVYDCMRTSPRLKSDAAFRDLSTIFDDTEGLVFIDYCHTTEAANARIASAMAANVLGVLSSRAPAAPKAASSDRDRGPNEVE